MKNIWFVYGILIQDQWVDVLIPEASRRWLKLQVSWSIKVDGEVSLRGDEWTLRGGIGCGRISQGFVDLVFDSKRGHTRFLLNGIRVNLVVATMMDCKWS